MISYCLSLCSARTEPASQFERERKCPTFCPTSGPSTGCHKPKPADTTTSVSAASALTTRHLIARAITGPDPFLNRASQVRFLPRALNRVAEYPRFTGQNPSCEPARTLGHTRAWKGPEACVRSMGAARLSGVPDDSSRTGRAISSSDHRGRSEGCFWATPTHVCMTSVASNREQHRAFWLRRLIGRSARNGH